jgi:hypothetical protein
LLLGVARAQVGLGRLVAARESYLRLLREGLPARPSEAFRRALADAEIELARLDPRVPQLLLSLEGPPETQLRLDEQAFPGVVKGLKIPVEPGPHRLQASADGHRDFLLQFTLAEGESRSITITLERLALAPQASASAAASAPPEPPPPLVSSAPGPGAAEAPVRWQRMVGWGSVGLGGVGLLAGGIWGFVAIDRKAELDDACAAAPRCPASALPLRRSYERAGNLSTAAFGVGLLGLGVGLPLLLLGSSSPKSAASPCTFQGQFGFCGHL